ncbi:AI-2E family transporter [Halobaculum sp. P14]|uniref:AI-2E family transporter n=1 Tax=Halobaculum sp. P14 TaxID=3421638 RepID=UPI003EBD3F9A
MQLCRRAALGWLLAGLLVVTGVVLAEVVQTVVFAVTVAYVLHPVRREVRERGGSRRVAAAAATGAAFVAVVVTAAPLVYLVYRQLDGILTFLSSLPESIPVTLAGFTYVVETGPLFDLLVDVLRPIGRAAASAAPVLALKVMLFVLVVYGLLYDPSAPRAAMLRLAPAEYHDIVLALHRRTAQTLRAIYVLQAATAVGTFAVAFVVFAALGYQSPFALAVAAGVLQFVPVVGPSIVVGALAGYDLVVGNVVRALLVTVLGLVFVGFAPDAVIRPRLAGETTDLPVSLYFVGFTGGLLTLGAVGFVVGPLVVALLAEVVALLSAGPSSQQTTLAESAPPDPVDPAAAATGSAATESAAATPTEQSGGDEPSER